MTNDLHVSRLTFIVDRHTTIKLYSHEISRLHHSLEWNILLTLVYSTPDYGVTYTKCIVAVRTRQAPVGVDLVEVVGLENVS